mmetsp:Transcript_14354/g.39526  ORF Transcript_14354/g.39526 Transcript_14354/m.39526 type:complete len:131 (-) Transcript_14354:2271-2663(-)
MSSAPRYGGLMTYCFRSFSDEPPTGSTNHLERKPPRRIIVVVVLVDIIIAIAIAITLALHLHSYCPAHQYGNDGNDNSHDNDKVNHSTPAAGVDDDGANGASRRVLAHSSILNQDSSSSNCIHGSILAHV